MTELDTDAAEARAALLKEAENAKADLARQEAEFARHHLPQVEAHLARVPAGKRRHYRKTLMRRIEASRKAQQARIARLEKAAEAGFWPEAHDDAAALIAEALDGGKGVADFPQPPHDRAGGHAWDAAELNHFSEREV
jgi:hypothetical protein